MTAIMLFSSEGWVGDGGGCILEQGVVGLATEEIRGLVVASPQAFGVIEDPLKLHIFILKP